MDSHLRRLIQDVRITMLLRNPFTRDARVLREARSLGIAGHDVTVIAIRTGSLPEEEVRDGFRVLRKVEARSWMGPTIVGADQSAPAQGGARGVIGGRLGTFAHRLARPPAAVMARDMAIERLFRQAGQELEADAIHAHDLNTLGAAVSIAHTRKIPVVYDAHELYPDLTGLSTLESRRWRSQEEELIPQTARVIAPTEARADVFRHRYGVDPAVVMNCPDAPAEGLDETRLASLRRPGEVLVVYAGGFTPNRGLANMIAAVGSMDGFRLALLGWGPLEDELRTQASVYGDRIVFAGAVDPDLVVPACSHADIGIVSYEPIGLNNELAAPNKLFEYLHSGLAIAGSDLPEVRGLLSKHQVGATFDSSSPVSIAAALQNLRDGNMAAMKARAKSAAANYTWQAQAKILIRIYEELMQP